MGTLFKSARLAIRTAVKLRDRGFPLQTLDLGDGFGHPFASPGRRPNFGPLRKLIETELDAALPGWRFKLNLIFESGRYLTSACGSLVTTVQDVKTSKGLVFVVLDSGINHLGGMSGLRRVAKVGLEPLTSAGGELMRVDIVGPLCTLRIPVIVTAHSG